MSTDLSHLEFAPSCDAATDGCGNAAKWTVVTVCCKDTGFSCDFHHAVMLRKLFAIAVTRRARPCAKCRHPIAGPDSFTIEPIGGSR